MADVIAGAASGRTSRRLRWAIARGLGVGALLLLGATTPGRVAGQDEGAAVLERRVKAALLYRFINYVEWPDSAFPRPDAPFVIGIAGADALAAELAEFARGRSVRNRPLVVRRIPAADAARDVHLLFVGKGDPSQAGPVVRSSPPNALIVTESDEGLRQGSVINFVIVDGQVRFEISLDAARKRNLRLSSRLLSVAHGVQGAAH